MASEIIRGGVCGPRVITRQINVGKIAIGGDAPVCVQSMTCTKTGDANATLEQIRELATAGAEIVRVTVNDEAAAEALPRIVRESNTPLVADIHFNHKLALSSLEAGIAKLRINPGNIGNKEKIREVAAAAGDKGVPIRIGVNGEACTSVTTSCTKRTRPVLWFSAPWMKLKPWPPWGFTMWRSA